VFFFILKKGFKKEKPNGKTNLFVFFMLKENDLKCD